MESDPDRVPVLADQPDAGDAYALQAESLLGRSAQLEQRRREARVPGEEARAETRIRNALQAADGLLDDTIHALRHLAKAAPPAQPATELVCDAAALDQIPWAMLLERCGATDGGTARQAVEDLKQVLTEQHTRAAPTVDEVSAALTVMRSQIKDLRDAQPGTLSVSRASQVLTLVGQVASAVAVGLLAATAGAASAGAGIVSVLLPAAVGVVVTALCGRLGDAVRAALHPATPGARLQAAHSDLAYMLADLVIFVGALQEGPANQGRYRTLARDTALAAAVTCAYAQNLAEELAWTSASAYAGQLEDLRQLLSQVMPPAAPGTAVPGDLAGRLRTAAGELSSRTIPGDLQPLTHAPRAPVPHPRPHEPVPPPPVIWTGRPPPRPRTSGSHRAPPPPERPGPIPSRDRRPERGSP